MEKLVEIMLNEGIDKNTIISVVQKLSEADERILPVSESCFNSLCDLLESYIHEYINKEKRNILLNTAVERQKRTDNAPEGPEKEEARKKENRNVELINKYFERHGSNLQKAHKRGYSKNATEKKALLNAGYVLKEDPIVKGRHNIVKY